ncbi:ATP-binding protein [Streptomyces sp. NPDC097704]|uniref:ATP-binding protein n=1 Tax=Streptomyces sp. NPDC097704 TaxID=3157101 RepID=UPI00331D64E4
MAQPLAQPLPFRLRPHPQRLQALSERRHHTLAGLVRRLADLGRMLFLRPGSSPSSSPRPPGAHGSRRLVAVRLDEWGVPYEAEAHETVVLVAAELAANAVRHGHVPGRDFHLSLRITAELARIEVSDTRAECVPPRPGRLPEGCRGLLLVEALAERWGWCPRLGAPGKTVWAECAHT